MDTRSQKRARLQRTRRAKAKLKRRINRLISGLVKRLLRVSTGETFAYLGETLMNIDERQNSNALMGIDMDDYISDDPAVDNWLVQRYLKVMEMRHEYKYNY